MKKFIYSLAGVLRVRKIQEEQARAEVAKALAEKKSYQEELEQLQGESLESKKRLKSKGTVDIADFRMNERYLEGVRIRTAELIEKLKKCDVNIENLKKDLNRKILETRKLETHQDKEKGLWKEENRRIEQAEFDDIANSRRR
ncbi:MAG: flagellar FliJ family protein [Lentisphaerales bacterium]|nr:flagellar FliJ family protein [Lentisphaerales bacterium]